MRTCSAVVVLVVSSVLLSAKSPADQQCAKQSEGTQQARRQKNDAAKPDAFYIQRPEGTQIHSESGNQQKAEKTDPPKGWWIEHINAGSTTIIAIFAIVTAWLAWIQIKTTKGVERPWAVVWVDYSIFKTAIERKFLEIPVVVICKNFGRTPAWIELTGIRTWTGLEKEFNPTWTAEWLQQSATVLAPNTPESFLQQVSTITYQDYMEVSAGNRTAFLYGVVIYKDASGSNHTTRFCYKYRFSGAIGGEAVEGFYAYGPKSYNKHT